VSVKSKNKSNITSAKATAKVKRKAKAKAKAKAKRKSKSKRTRKRKSTNMCKKVNVQQGRTGDPTHHPRQDDRERPCRAGMLQAGPPPNLAPAQPLQTQIFFIAHHSGVFLGVGWRTSGNGENCHV